MTRVLTLVIVMELEPLRKSNLGTSQAKREKVEAMMSEDADRDGDGNDNDEYNDENCEDSCRCWMLADGGSDDAVRRHYEYWRVLLGRGDHLQSV